MVIRQDRIFRYAHARALRQVSKRASSRPARAAEVGPFTAPEDMPRSASSHAVVFTALRWNIV